MSEQQRSGPHGAMRLRAPCHVVSVASRHSQSRNGETHAGKHPTGFVFSDHTDVRPTTTTLLGLKDDHVHDGRALFEVMNETVRPVTLRQHTEARSVCARWRSRPRTSPAPIPPPTSRL
jgi:hypothetical protein